MENDSASAGSDSSASMESSDSQQISSAQQEVQDTTSSGNSDVGSYDQIKQNTADLEQQGTLPSFSLDDGQAGQADNNSQASANAGATSQEAPPAADSAVASQQAQSTADYSQASQQAMPAADSAIASQQAQPAADFAADSAAALQQAQPAADSAHTSQEAQTAMSAQMDNTPNYTASQSASDQMLNGFQIDNNQYSLNSAEQYLGEGEDEDEEDDAAETSSENTPAEAGGKSAAEENASKDGTDKASAEADAMKSNDGGSSANDGKQDRSFMENFRSSLARNFAAASIAASSMFSPSADLPTSMSRQPEPATQTQTADSGLQVQGMNYDERAEKPAPTAPRECEAMDKTVADGRMVPSLTVKLAGLPESQSNASLSAFPVDNNDKSDEQTFATTAHGFTKLPNQTLNNNYELLDDGFKKTDLDQDGSLSKDELQNKMNGTSESTDYQAKYVLDNYDKIADTSKKLNPSSNGVSNEGLAQHYMENAQITVKTPDGTSFPAHVESGDRNTDVAILKATELTPDQKNSVGKNFEIAPKDASKGDFVTSYGHVRGIEQAEKLCHIPNQTSGLVTTDKEKGQLIPGDVQQAKLGTMGGMSGGPVVNANDNKVVGMNHAGWDERVNKIYVPASAIKDEMAKIKKH